jgi:hypothetical protein
MEYNLVMSNIKILIISFSSSSVVQNISKMNFYSFLQLFSFEIDKNRRVQTTNLPFVQIKSGLGQGWIRWKKRQTAQLNWRLAVPLRESCCLLHRSSWFHHQNQPLYVKRKRVTIFKQNSNSFLKLTHKIFSILLVLRHDLVLSWSANGWALPEYRQLISLQFGYTHSHFWIFVLVRNVRVVVTKRLPDKSFYFAVPAPRRLVDSFRKNGKVKKFRHNKKGEYIRINWVVFFF